MGSILTHPRETAITNIVITARSTMRLELMGSILTHPRERAVATVVPGHDEVGAGDQLQHLQPNGTTIAVVASRLPAVNLFHLVAEGIVAAPAAAPWRTSGLPLLNMIVLGQSGKRLT